MSYHPSATDFALRMMFTSCALACDDAANEASEKKSACVRGCRLARDALGAGALAEITVLRLEEDEFHERKLERAELEESRRKLQSLSGAVLRACKQVECAKATAQSGSSDLKGNEQAACELGCDAL